MTGTPAREVVSAGQGKLLATGLKLAGVAVVEKMRNVRPLVVFDDVDADLDATALARVVGRIAKRGQALLCSAHAAMIAQLAGPVCLWRLHQGTVVPESGGEVS